MNTLDIFETRIPIRECMISVNDIRNAYLEYISSKKRPVDSFNKYKRIDKWLKNQRTKRLISYLQDNWESLGYEDERSILSSFEGRDGGTFVCDILAYNFILWLDSTYAVEIPDHIRHAAHGYL